MTRTFLKGKASDAQRRLVRTVRKGYDLSLDLIKPGVTGGSVHNAVADFFTKEGYETNKNSDQLKGFFHALGHGVGLEIHEAPIMRANSKWRFKKGMVITTELVMIATIVTLAMVVGLTEVSHAVTGELIDVANSYNAMNQGRRYQNLGWNNNSSNGSNWDNSIIQVTGTPARDEDQ